MIKTKTLFILGAGASVPFEYPSGIKLRENILSGGMNPKIIESFLPDYDNYDQDEDDRIEKDIHLEEFISAFSRSGVYSIDLFLENRPDFMGVGKRAIAAYLISCEIDKNLRRSKDNWYMYLFNRLKSSFEDFDKNKISFITFNYDRSLEYFLFEALRNLFKRDERLCAEKINKIPIVHLYGKLDSFPWQNAKNGFPYDDSKFIKERIHQAIYNIRIMDDVKEYEETEAFKSAYKLISNAEQIFLLGFGFDKINLERLKVEQIQEKTLIYGTAKGIEHTKLDFINSFFQSRTKATLCLEDKDSLELLERYLNFE